MRPIPVLLLAATAGLGVGCAADVDFTCGGDAPMCDILEVTADERRRASGIRITRVALLQGIHADIMADGATTEPIVPAVAGRDAVFRVFVEPAPGFSVRDITARVTLFKDGVVVGAAQSEARPGAISDMDSMASTLNVRVPGDMLLPGELEWEVELLEAAGALSQAGSSSEAIFPAQGDLPATLAVEDGGPSLRIYLVPVSWDEDGSGQLPATTPTAIEVFRQHMYGIFPVADVEIEVAEPMPWPNRSTITSQTLQAVASLREERQVDSDQYIYGLLNPSIGSGGGAAGLSFLAGTPRDAGQRASIGLSMAEGAGASVMAHEIGHAHGRPHTPGCGAAGADENYPHEDSSIGVYGYDLVNDSLKGPEAYKDLMSYCGPEWISDYNYIRFFGRQQGIFEEVLGGADGVEDRTRQTAWRRIWLHTDGEVADGGVTWLRDMPVGERHQVELADGTTVEGVLAPFNHAEGGVLYVPTDDVVDTVRIDGGPALVVEEPSFRR